MAPVVPSAAYRSSVSSRDCEGSEIDLEQQQQAKKRLSFAARQSYASYDPPASCTSYDPPEVLGKSSDSEDLPPSHWPHHYPGILRQGRFTTRRRNHRAHSAFSIIFFVGTVAFIIGSVAHVLNGGQLAVYSRNLLKGQADNQATFEAVMQMIYAETAGLPEEERQRILKEGKSTWNECINDPQYNTAIKCKEHIDEEILTLNTETDKFIRTIIVGKRQENDPLSNAVVLFMDDNDRVMGRDKDGKVYYDFKWKGSGNEATRYQQRKIPEIIATEVKDEPTLDSINVTVVPIRTLGASTYDAINGYSDADISGGVRTLGTETDTAAGETKLATALAETATIEEAGERTIGPFDCAGMTGHSCCLMIKHKIRDADIHGKAIQCYLDYHEETQKHKALLNARGKKVFIFTNHKGRISKEPKVVGDWPQGKTSDQPGFHEWIQDGGGLSNGQMRLIHGPDWEPPEQAQGFI